jgi:hypothetical protein
LQHFLIARKSQQALACDDLITDVNGELAFLSAGSFNLGAKLILE